MQRLVLPLSLLAALVAGVTLAQMDRSERYQTVSLGMCLKTGLGCSR